MEKRRKREELDDKKTAKLNRSVASSPQTVLASVTKLWSPGLRSKILDEMRKYLNSGEYRHNYFQTRVRYAQLTGLTAEYLQNCTCAQLDVALINLGLVGAGLPNAGNEQRRRALLFLEFGCTKFVIN